MFRRLQQRAHGLIKLVDIAPEEEGAQEFIRDCKDEVRISLAHTCTNYETAKQAFAAGASHMTHLYNAMPAITHRAPGPIIAAWEDGAEVELITDGVHIHPAMVRFTFEIFGAERVILIADSMMACGLPDGQYSLGGQAVTVHGARATLTEQPDVIAGSATCLYDCMKRAVLEMGVPLESAVRAASENPARSLGIEADYGSIAAGRWGNVILADRELNIRHVIRKGEIIA
jgi:N-acetylglucosamine-6-phosphate deacetylase